MRISDWSSDVCSSDLLSEDEFRALRLRNGLYMQRFAPMLRINVPYGHLNAAQLRRLGHITRKYSKGYGHFPTHPNGQLTWPHLDDVQDSLWGLAEVDIQRTQARGTAPPTVPPDPPRGREDAEH